MTSAFPVNVVQGSDLNGDGIKNDPPLFSGRTDTPGYGFKEVDLHISRTFRLTERFRVEIIGEARTFSTVSTLLTRLPTVPGRW